MCSGKPPSTRRLRATAGFSLIEALVATVFLGVALLGLASSAISLTRNEKTADSTSAAHGLVTQKLEQLRSLPLDAIAPHVVGATLELLPRARPFHLYTGANRFWIWLPSAPKSCLLFVGPAIALGSMCLLLMIRRSGQAGCSSHCPS